MFMLIKPVMQEVVTIFPLYLKRPMKSVVELVGWLRVMFENHVQSN